jgi:2-succinyl-5-enolpyruvyl-6-hydroxy-3-cyclohexene-1-carboxylate synthase
MLQRHDVRTYASRGANGIDGQLATALGMAENCDGVFHCILGDQTFLYDISSCLKPWPKNFRLHIINNGGGRIFERVKVPKEIILEHDDSLMPILEAFKKGNQSAEYLPDNKQTQKFWKHWEKL